MSKLLISSILSKNNLVCLSSLLFSTSIICPLASCGSDGSSNDIGGFDKEFGFDVQTYNRLENEFKIKYRNQLLDDNNIDKNVAFDKYDNFLQNDITSIRNQLFDPAKNYSFTVRTNALMDYASKNYNIYLNRNADVSETAFDNLKQSSLENFIIYLDNVYGIDSDEKDKQITNFSTRFNQLLSEIPDKYKDKDKAEVLMYLRAGIINCWQDLNQKFALLAASNHLRDFFDDYQFIIKDQSDKQTDINELLWDNLLYNDQFITNGKTGLINQDIDCLVSDWWINELFNITKKKNSNENDSSSNQDDLTLDILSGYKEIDNFNSQEIIPGYTLAPVLKTMSQDIYANEYYMSIDWQLISNKYKDESNHEIKDNVTAHLAHNVGKTNSGQQFSSNDYTFIDYQLQVTPTYEKNNLKKAYFTNSEPSQNIVFSWDQDKTPLEQFFPSDINYQDEEPMIIKNQYDVSMKQNNLSNACLKVNDKFLSNLLIAEYKIPHSQDNVNIDNSSSKSTSSLEKKFVYYCEITSATSNITFYNNNESQQSHNNKICTTFNIRYKNSQIEFPNVGTPAEIVDVKLSNNFCDDAIGCYKDVNNFTDSQQITDVAKTISLFSSDVKIYLYIMIAFLVITFIVLTIKHWKSKSNNSNNQLMVTITNHPLISFAIILALAAILLIVWCCTIDAPINKHVDGIKKWNDALQKDDEIDKLNVLKKIKDDKKNFSSVGNFQKYFENNRSKAYSSYWYYLHFNNTIVAEKNKSTNNKESTQVVKDYMEFINKRKEYTKSSEKKFLKIFLHICFILLLIFWLALIVLVIYTLLAKNNNNNNIDIKKVCDDMNNKKYNDLNKGKRYQTDADLAYDKMLQNSIENGKPENTIVKKFYHEYLDANKRANLAQDYGEMQTHISAAQHAGENLMKQAVANLGYEKIDTKYVNK